MIQSSDMARVKPGEAVAVLAVSATYTYNTAFIASAEFEISPVLGSDFKPFRIHAGYSMENNVKASYVKATNKTNEVAYIAWRFAIDPSGPWT